MNVEGNKALENNEQLIKGKIFIVSSINILQGENITGKRKGSYKKGDQVHFIITEDFASTYEEFIEYCNENSMNASSAIRKAISNWLADRKKEEKQFSYWKKSNYKKRK